MTTAVANSADSELERTALRKVTVRLIPLLICLYVLAFVDRSAIGMAKLTMNADLGISDAAYGLGAGLFFIGYFIFEVPSNLLMHRFGAKSWFVRILLTWGLITALMALATGPISFYILRFLLGAAEAGFFPGVIYYLTLWFPAKQRKSATAQFVLSQPIALLIMSPLGGWILGLNGIGMKGWQWLFVVLGVAAMIGAWPTWKLLPNHPKDVHWLTAEEAGWIQAKLDEEAKSQTDHKNPLKVLADGRVLLLAFVYVLLCTGVYGLSLWLPSVVSKFSTSLVETGWLSALPYVFGILGLLFTSWAMKRYRGSYLPLFIAFFGSAAGLFLSVMIGSPVAQMVFLCFTAFFLYPTTPAFYPIPSAIFVGASAAAAIATINSVGNLGGFVGPYVVGWISQTTGSPQNGMYFLASVLLLAAVMVGVVKWTLGRQAPAQLKQPATAQ